MEDQELTGKIIGGAMNFILIIKGLRVISPLTLNRGLARSRSLGLDRPLFVPDSFR
jgi:hypothetical protein